MFFLLLDKCCIFVCISVNCKLIMFMKKNILFVILTTLSLVFSQAQIAFQGFEGTAADTWGYTSDPGFYNLGADFWELRTFTDQIVAYKGNFVGGEDLRNTINSTGMTTLTFDPVAVSVEVEISFRIQYKGYDTADYITLEIMYDNGSSWSSPHESIIVLSNIEPGTTADWTLVTAIVPSGISFVRARLVISQNGSDEIGIDEFKIEPTVPLSVNNSDIEGFSYAPNPTTNSINLIANTVIDKAIVYNTLGQQLFEQSGISNRMHLNLENLISGGYVVKIISEGKTKTIRVIKN